jgi:hypothetical protein
VPHHHAKQEEANPHQGDDNTTSGATTVDGKASAMTPERIAPRWLLRAITFAPASSASTSGGRRGPLFSVAMGDRLTGRGIVVLLVILAVIGVTAYALGGRLPL